MAKASKASKKFAASGQLKKTIQARHKHQKHQKRIQGRRGASNRNKKPGDGREDEKDGVNGEEADDEDVDMAEGDAR